MKNMNQNWEQSIDINKVIEIRGRNNVYLGVGAIHKVNDIALDMKKRSIKKIIIISGKSAYIKTGAWGVVEPALKNNGIEYVLFNKVTPNPTDTQCDEAAKMALEFGAQAVIGIGGGSPIDTAKSVAILMAYPGKTAEQLYQFDFVPEKAVPILAINTTHGTGTEIDRFAVVTVTKNEFKPAIAYDCIYPTWAIDDPALMTLLPADQSRFVSIDAVNHVVEAATTKVNSPFTILLAKETIRLVHKYLPIVLDDPNNLEARYFLLYASMIAGMAFDNGLLHFTHALEHPLSAVKPDLAHGLGLAMILPAVVKTIYPAQSSVLSELFADVVPGLNGTPDEGETLAKGIEKWLFEVGITQKLSDEGFNAEKVERLVELAFTTPSLDGLLGLAPVTADRDAVRKIYTESLKSYN
jgi:alcohol dehydrogenase class IV